MMLASCRPSDACNFRATTDFFGKFQHSSAEVIEKFVWTVLWTCEFKDKT
jgi:hypothetical protein